MPLGDRLHKSLADEQRTADRRAGRYAARHWLWGNSGVKRIRACGRVRRGGDAGTVGVRVSVDADSGTRSAGWAGLQHCGSVWGCPCCSAKIAAQRQSEIMAALTEQHRRGGRVVFWTGTVQHHAGQALAPMWDHVGQAWTAATSGAAWVAEQALYGEMFERVVKTGKHAGETRVSWRIPFIRLAEVKYGIPTVTDETGRSGSGWHPHVHALLFVPDGITEDQVAGLGASMFKRWKSSLESNGRTASWGAGHTVKLITGDPAAALGEYFTKAVFSTAAEVTRSDLKRSKTGYSVSPFDMLSLLVLADTGELTPDRDAADLGYLTPEVVEDLRGAWGEWERASKGRRQITWSPGLRASLLGDETEATDEELADAELDGQIVAEVDPDTLAAITDDRADFRILQAFVTSDEVGHRALVPYVLAGERRAAARAAGRGRMKQRT